MATKSAKPLIRNKKLTAKQKIVQESALQRQKVQEQVFAWQEHLFTEDSVSAATLIKVARWLQPQTYDEIVEERSVQSMCGYPLCSNAPEEQESRYRISLSQRKVFDQSERMSYCSLACLQKSRYYAMQLSEDPVWVRDLTGPHSSPIHVITLDENFKQAVAQKQQQQQHSSRSSHDLRRDYVQKLLSNVPRGSNNNNSNNSSNTAAPSANQLDMIIVEKAPETPSSSTLDLSFGGAHDAIEGYRIENSKKATNEPTTILLTKANPSPLQPPQSINSSSPVVPDDGMPVDTVDMNPDSLLDDAMETMMMLKKMNLDRDPPPPESETNELSHHDQPPPASPANSHVSKQQDDLPAPSRNTTNASVAHLSIIEPSDSSKPLTSTLAKDDKSTKAAVAAIEAAAAAAAATKAKKAKKRKEPEMSLFGKIWTMLDRMTTKSTRLYLTTLATMDGHPMTQVQLLEEDGLTDDSLLRGHIFSEKILESYAIIRAQLGIKGELEMDMVNLIRTFRFADATMVVLDSSQTFMFSLVLFKALVPLVLNSEVGWEEDFELCCRQIGQTSEMVDACVRVLKVAST